MIVNLTSPQARKIVTHHFPSLTATPADLDGFMSRIIKGEQPKMSGEIGMRYWEGHFGLVIPMDRDIPAAFGMLLNMI